LGAYALWLKNIINFTFFLWFFSLRLIQYILKSPCDRMALLSRNLKSSEDYPLSSASEGIEDDLSSRYKREIVSN
jgi:hypothetical protein